MTVHELRAILAGLPDDHLVVLAGDAEGNSYSPLASTLPCEYTDTHPWWGEVRPATDEDGSIFDVEVNAICLWPVR